MCVKCQFDLFIEVEQDRPVVGGRDPRPYEQIDTAVVECAYGDHGCRVGQDAVIRDQQTFENLFGQPNIRVVGNSVNEVDAAGVFGRVIDNVARVDRSIGLDHFTVIAGA